MKRKILMLLAPFLALGLLALQGCYGAAPGYGYGGGYGSPAYSSIGMGPSYAYGGGYPVYEPGVRGGYGGWGDRWYGDHDWNRGLYRDAHAFTGGHNVGGNALAGGHSFGGRSVGGNGHAVAAHAGAGHGGGGHGDGHGRS